MNVATPSIQHARPRLKSGQIFGPMTGAAAAAQRRQSLLYELSDGSRQVSLPHEAAHILPLLDGSKTIPDILEVLQRTQGRVPFKTFFGVLQKLQAQGCLDGAEALVTSDARNRIEMFERPPLWLTRSIYSVTVAPGKVMGEPSVVAFVLFAVATLIVTLSFLIGSIWLGLVHVPTGFLRIQESYVKGILFFFAASSVLITAKTIIKTILSLFMTGARSAISLEVGLFSIALRTHDDKIYMAGGRALGALAMAAVASSYFFIFAVASAVAPHWSRLDDLFWISAILALVDLNPFRKSDLASFFNIVYNRNSTASLLPYLKSRGLLAFTSAAKDDVLETSTHTAYSTIAVAWVMVAYNLLLAIITKNDALLASSIVQSFETGNRVETFAAGLVAAALGLSLIYLVFDLFRIFANNILFPLVSERLAKKAEKKASPATLENVEALARSLSTIPLFAGLHPDALLFLFSKGQARAIPAGAPIVVQGTVSTELFILLEGEVSIQRRHPTGAVETLTQLQAPTVFGENTLLNNATRSADVFAVTPVRVVAIPRKAIDELMSHPVLRTEAETLLDRLILGQYIAASDLFRDAPVEVVTLFFNEGEIVDIATGRHIIEQGRTDKDFYLLIRGSVDVIKDGAIVRRLGQGEFFGETALIMNAPRNATIMSREPCRLLKLSARQFWAVLSQHASIALYLETVSENRGEELSPHAS